MDIPKMAPTTTAQLPQDVTPLWQAAGWSHVIAPLRQDERDQLAKLGCVPSGYRKANRSPEGSSCSDGDDDIGMFVPASWLIPNHEHAAGWRDAGTLQGIDLDGWLIAAIPHDDGRVTIWGRDCGPDVCDWPYSFLRTLKAQSGPTPDGSFTVGLGRPGPSASAQPRRERSNPLKRPLLSLLDKITKTMGFVLIAVQIFFPFMSTLTFAAVCVAVICATIDDAGTRRDG